MAALYTAGLSWAKVGWDGWAVVWVVGGRMVMCVSVLNPICGSKEKIRSPCIVNSRHMS